MFTLGSHQCRTGRSHHSDSCHGSFGGWLYSTTFCPFPILAHVLFFPQLPYNTMVLVAYTTGIPFFPALGAGNPKGKCWYGCRWQSSVCSCGHPSVVSRTILMASFKLIASLKTLSQKKKSHIRRPWDLHLEYKWICTFSRLGSKIDGRQERAWLTSCQVMENLAPLSFSLLQEFTTKLQKKAKASWLKDVLEY